MFGHQDQVSTIEEIIAQQMERRALDEADVTFGADYFLVEGHTSALADYTGYKPEISEPRAKALYEHLNLQPVANGEVLRPIRLFEFGCANGGTVRALKDFGVEAWGCDISKFAIRDSQSCNIEGRDPTAVADRIFQADQLGLADLASKSFDWVIAKDVMEHIPGPEMLTYLEQALLAASTGVLIRVPVTHEINGPYIIPHMERDETHVIRWPKLQWIKEIKAAAERMDIDISIEDDDELNNALNNVRNDTYDACEGIGCFVIRIQ